MVKVYLTIETWTIGGRAICYNDAKCKQDLDYDKFMSNFYFASPMLPL